MFMVLIKEVGGLVPREKLWIGNIGKLPTH
jgi:hypothetical protein